MDGFTGPGYADTAGSADTDAAPAPQKGRNRMVSRVHTVAFNGVDVLDIDCQVQLSSGMVAFNVVGLPDKAVAESRERVRAALAAMGLALPPKRIAVNLAPADVLKEGAHFDLPIAVALLMAMDVIPADAFENHTILGELSLDGRLAPVAGVLPAAIGANAAGRGIVCPAVQGGEAAWAGDIDVLAPASLLALVNHVKGTQVLTPPKPALAAHDTPIPDMRDVKGQESAKRALEIAAAGGHNLLLCGPPGSGKSMLAARLPGLLPPLSPAEALDLSMIHSVAGQLDGGRLLMRRPFRDPHHSATLPALIGGGLRARPGEVSLAHRGVLFLDELPEFDRRSLEALRQPLESGRAVVARANTHVTYPARFQLVAAMNPCKCGWLDNPALACSRVPRCAADYQAKISGPLFDRIDLHVDVPAVKPADLALCRARRSRFRRPRRHRQRGGRRRSARRHRHAGCRRHETADRRRRTPAFVRPRLAPHPPRRPHHCGFGRLRRRPPGTCGGGAGLPPGGAGAVGPFTDGPCPIRYSLPDPD